MTGDFIEYGEAYLNPSQEHLITPAARKTWQRVTERTQKDFEIIDLRYLKKGDDIAADVIVVDCLNDQVPTRNSFGIKTRERIALVLPVDQSQMPSVHALRKDFPITPHQNHVNHGEPACLCLYFESWTAVQRTWTPQKHLHRVLWWLAETAKGTLHRDDQPVEHLYLNSGIELVLPPDFDVLCSRDDLVFTMSSIKADGDDSNFKMLIGDFFDKSQAYKNGWPHHIPIVITLQPIIHAGIERFPDTLGAIEEQLLLRGISVVQSLCQEVRILTPTEGCDRNQKGRCLLIFNIPIKRTQESSVERIEHRAFMILSDFTVLGEALGVLDGHTGKYCAVQLIGVEQNSQSESWKQLSVIPVDVKRQVTKNIARKASGISGDTADFRAILTGVGALGSTLADLWSREAWGEWTIVDPDHVEPHNPIRHIAKNFQIGLGKAEAVKQLLEYNYYPKYRHVEAISDSILNMDQPKIQEAIASADFLIDVTTTLYVPRELSQNTNIPRSASAFLTPSGFGSVLLIEDAEQKVRLESLEAQYYRAIINSDWGVSHLGGHLGQLWVGAGCRDVSAVISFEMIQLHAATLARRIRVMRDQKEPVICVWEANPLTGSLAAHMPSVFTSKSKKCDLWRVLWDIGTEEKLKACRHQRLPNETGGVILGYIDQKLQTIFVVDILASPPDSVADASGFTRGVSGLNATLDEIAMRTANIVGYIGEWHSHPPQCSAQPSSIDYQLIKSLAETLAQDGQPALMMIVGANEITVTVQED